MKEKTMNDCNKWNWQKIVVPGVNQLNLPPFKKPVLLFATINAKKYAMVGFLQTLDINGPHWSTGTDSFSEIFGSIFGSTPQLEYFNPTHWCEIELPEENETK